MRWFMARTSSTHDSHFAGLYDRVNIGTNYHTMAIHLPKTRVDADETCNALVYTSVHRIDQLFTFSCTAHFVDGKRTEYYSMLGKELSTLFYAFVETLSCHACVPSECCKSGTLYSSLKMKVLGFGNAQIGTLT